jgi:hypothetical protein
MSEGRVEPAVVGTAEWHDDELETLRQDLGVGDRTPMRDGGRSFTAESGEDPPYDLESPDPIAVDLLGLWRRMGKEPDPSLLATLGPNRPVLLSHGITAFHKMGRSPRAIWGMGYQATIPGGARTLDVSPASAHLTVGSVQQDVRLAITLGGRIGASEEVLAAAAAIPGVTLNGAELEAGVDERVAFTVRFEFRVLKVQSGPVAPGGARWNLYRQDEPLDDFQPLLQTVLVPKDAERLTVEVRSWAREAGWFGPGREWTFVPRQFEVPLTR